METVTADFDSSCGARTLVELQALIADYWASVDRLEDAKRPAASFYVEQGEMLLGTLAVRGRGELEAFFRDRNSAEVRRRRTTRHVATNFRMQIEQGSRVTLRVLVLAYAGIGDLPLPSEVPSALGDFTFRCLRDPSGDWLFERVTGTSVFVGTSAPAFARGPVS